MIKSDRCLRLTPLPITGCQNTPKAESKWAPIPLCLKFRVHTRSQIRLTLVALDTIVEHTKSVGKRVEAPKYRYTHRSSSIPGRM